MKIVILMAILIGTCSARAQDVFSNKTNTALEKVIRDFPNRFKNIKGELLADHTHTAQYRSSIQVPGSMCTVTRYQVSNSDAYSWNCMAYESRDFAMAKAKFKEIFEQIQNTIIKLDGEKPFIVSGQYKAPFEDKKLTVIGFDLLPAVGEMQKVRVELKIQNVSSSWRVALEVFDNSLKDDLSTAINN